MTTEKKYGVGTLEEAIRKVRKMVVEGHNFTTPNPEDLLVEGIPWTAPIKLRKLAKAMDLDTVQTGILFDYIATKGKITMTTGRRVNK